MTTKNMDARREVFEKWANNRGASLAKDLAGHYLIAENEWAFDIWNAALDSVCVELPKGNSDMTAGALHMIVRCREAIHAAGIKTK